MPGTTVQDYGKEPRAGRKVGHITLIADDEATLHLRLRQVLALVEIE